MPSAMYRLNRMFDPVSGRCLDVAVDHGFFGEPSFLAGIEDMPRTVETLVGAGPDAIQLAPGHAHLLQSRPGRGKPALVLRTDVANVYGKRLDSYVFSQHFPDAVEQAVRLDAVCVVANLLQLPGRPEVHEQCIVSIMALRAACASSGMALMIEPLVMRENDAGGYMVDGDAEKIVALVRQARELGADVIKADPTDKADEYHHVVTVAGGVPVLVRGGGRVTDQELFHRTEQLLAQGVAGFVYGRNVIQHPDPSAMVRALMAMLHADVSANAAHAMLHEE